MAYKTNMIGPKPLADWIKCYEEREGALDTWYEKERMVYIPQYGFYTYYLDFEKQFFVVPKMCGNGRELRKGLGWVYSWLKSSLPNFNLKGVICPILHDVQLYLRAYRGTVLYSLDYHYEFGDKTAKPIWWLLFPDGWEMTI